MKKFIIVVIAIFSLPFLAFTIQKEEDQVIETYDEGIVYNLGVFPDNLSTDISSRQEDLIYCIFQGIVKEEDGGIVPAICQDYFLSEDNLTYTFKIRNDAKWSNGKNITAMDFKLYYDSVFKDLEYKYKSLNSVVSVKTTDLKTLEITLSKEEKNFLVVLSSPELCVRSLDDEIMDYKDNYKEIRYSGPFKINDVLEDKIVLEDNINYYDYSMIKAKKIIITNETLNERALAKFDEGEIDILISNVKSEDDRLLIENLAKKYTFSETTSIIVNEDSDIAKNDFVVSSLNNIQGASVIKKLKLNNKNPSLRDKSEECQGEYRDVVKLYNVDLDENNNISNYIVECLKNKGIEVENFQVSDEEFQSICDEKNYDIILGNLEDFPEDNIINIPLFSSSILLCNDKEIEGIYVNSFKNVILEDIYTKNSKE
ncbi:MAG: ABC transporter substrate-binding protein [Clostridiaceae bacterium]